LEEFQILILIPIWEGERANKALECRSSENFGNQASISATHMGLRSPFFFPGYDVLHQKRMAIGVLVNIRIGKEIGQIS